MFQTWWWNEYASLRFQSRTARQDIRPEEVDGFLHVLYGSDVAPQSASGLIIDLFQFLQADDLEDYVEYLARSSEPVPQLVFPALERAAEGLSLATSPDTRVLLQLLSANAQASPQRAWHAANVLARQGLFGTEEIAHELALRLDIVAGSD